MLIFVYCCEYPLGLFLCHLHKSSHIRSSPSVACHFSSCLALLTCATRNATSPGRLSQICEGLGCLLTVEKASRIRGLMYLFLYPNLQLNCEVHLGGIFKFLKCCNVSQSQSQSRECNHGHQFHRESRNHPRKCVEEDTSRRLLERWRA